MSADRHESMTPSSILVVYDGAAAALVNLRQLSFLGPVRHLSPGHPVVRIVAHMAYYAQLVLAGELPGPYSDEAAQRFARFALIGEAALSARPSDDDISLAAGLRVPPEQIPKARQDRGGPDGP